MGRVPGRGGGHRRAAGWSAFFAAVVLLVAPPAVDQASQFSRELPATVRELYSWPIVGSRLEKADAAGDVEDAIDELPAKLDDKTLADLGERLLGGILSTVVVLITALGVLVDGERDGAARSAPSCRRPARSRPTAWARIVYHSFGSYFAGSLLVAVLNGLVMLTVGLVLGVPLAPIAALWAMLTNFIPQIGGFLGGSFFVLLALTESPLTAFIAGRHLPRLPAVREQRDRPGHRRQRGEPHPARHDAGRARGRRGGRACPGALVATPLMGAAKALYLDRRGALPSRREPALRRRLQRCASSDARDGIRSSERSTRLSRRARRRPALDRRADPPACLARVAGEVGGAAVGADGGVHDGQPEAAAALVAAAGRVGPVEALEGPGGVLGRHAGPVVGHLEDGVRRRPRGRAPRSARPGRVTRALPTRLATTWRSRSSSPRDDRPAPAASSVDRRGRGRRRGRRHRVVGQRREVDRGALERPALVEAGQEEQVSTRLPMRTASCSVRRMASSSSSASSQAAGAVELGVAPDRRDRRAQLVGGVGHELAQPVLGRGSLRRRPPRCARAWVQGHAELAGLGAGGALGHALGEVAGGDRRGGRRSSA